MTFARAKLGGWAFGEVLTSTQMNDLDIDHTFALDGRAGGVYNSSAGIEFRNSWIFNGDSLPVSGATIMVDVIGSTSYNNAAAAAAGLQVQASTNISGDGGIGAIINGGDSVNAIGGLGLQVNGATSGAGLDTTFAGRFDAANASGAGRAGDGIFATGGDSAETEPGGRGLTASAGDGGLTSGVGGEGIRGFGGEGRGATIDGGTGVVGQGGGSASGDAGRGLLGVGAAPGNLTGDSGDGVRGQGASTANAAASAGKGGEFDGGAHNAGGTGAPGLTADGGIGETGGDGITVIGGRSDGLAVPGGIGIVAIGGLQTDVGVGGIGISATGGAGPSGRGVAIDIPAEDATGMVVRTDGTGLQSAAIFISSGAQDDVQACVTVRAEGGQSAIRLDAENGGGDDGAHIYFGDDVTEGGQLTTDGQMWFRNGSLAATVTNVNELFITTGASKRGLNIRINGKLYGFVMVEL